MSHTPSTPTSHLFEHEAMNTTYSLRICHPDPGFAAGMAHDCFEALDQLEGKLSRFIEDSDITRINVMREGETLYISEETHACLLQALEFHTKTRGLFDITLGRVIEHQKNGEEGPPPPITGNLVIHPDRPAVSCTTPGRELDLGGIGKGFALDHLKKKLIDWGAEAALLSAGASTRLAYGEHSWPIDISGEHTTRKLALKNAALSASGTGIQGSHIIHPDGEDMKLPWKHVWLTAPTAIAADVWSTALMLMGDPQVLEIPEISAEISSLFVEEGQEITEVLRPLS